MNEEKVTLMIDKIVWEKFRRYCATNAFKISRKIELLLEEEIEKGPNTKNLVDMFKDIMESGQIGREDMNIHGAENKNLNEIEKSEEVVEQIIMSNDSNMVESMQAKTENPEKINEVAEKKTDAESEINETTENGLKSEIQTEVNYIVNTGAEKVIEAEVNVGAEKAIEAEESSEVNTGAEMNNIENKETDNSKVFEAEAENSKVVPKVDIEPDNPKMIDPDAKVPTIDELRAKKRLDF